MIDIVVRTPSAPPAPWRGVVHLLWTSNPFYVISAALFLFGLRVSFGPQVKDLEAGILMAGLAGYVLLLAATALTLVRFGNVWDDVRTVMLLVVLMFLATSVTFDELLVRQPLLAKACQIGGFAFAVLVSEILLRGSRLKMPAWFRGPYYLILGLFFLYPLALSPFLGRPDSVPLRWGLFLFSTVAGLAFLTLLPAIRRGPKYVANNGSPWTWPLYPWVLFGMLALAVPARTYLMCLSMHWVDMAHANSTIFGGYFLAPLGLCLAVLLLEFAVVGRNRAVTRVALAMPIGFVGLSFVGNWSDVVYQDFVRIFRERLGGDPLYFTIVAATAFYFYAAMRRVEGAIGAVTAMLFAISYVGTDFLTRGPLRGTLLWPIALATALHLGLGIWDRVAKHWPVAALGCSILTLAACVHFHVDGVLSFAAALHVGVGVLIAGGVWCRDEMLRFVGGIVLFLIAGLFVAGATVPSPAVPRWANDAYPFAVATALGCCGVLSRDRPLMAFAILLLGGWLLRTGWRGYSALRDLITGLNQIVLSLTLFAIAVAVSLRKSGRLTNVFGRRETPKPVEVDAGP